MAFVSLVGVDRKSFHCGGWAVLFSSLVGIWVREDLEDLGKGPEAHRPWRPPKCHKPALLNGRLGN